MKVVDLFCITENKNRCNHLKMLLSPSIIFQHAHFTLQLYAKDTKMTLLDRGYLSPDEYNNVRKFKNVEAVSFEHPCRF